MAELGQEHYYYYDDNDESDGRVVDYGGDVAQVPAATTPCDLSLPFFFFFILCFFVSKYFSFFNSLV